MVAVAQKPWWLQPFSRRPNKPLARNRWPSKPLDVSLSSSTRSNLELILNILSGALLQLPITIADNAGYDSAQLVAELRAAHTAGKFTTGLNMDEGKVDDMVKLGITESYVVKRQVLLSAAEAAEMILRVDDIIRCAPRRRVQDRGMC